MPVLRDELCLLKELFGVRVYDTFLSHHLIRPRFTPFWVSARLISSSTNMGAFRSQVFGLFFCTLCAIALVVAQVPHLSDKDRAMVEKALARYKHIHQASNVPYQPYETDIDTFEHFPRLREGIHNVGVPWGSSLLIGEDKPFFRLLGRGKTVTYYSTLVRPTNGEIADQLSLHSTPEHGELMAMALWRHEENVARLLRIDRFVNTGANFELRDLESIIKVNRINELH